jgi:holo-[acyl-carrier protein] synthase
MCADPAFRNAKLACPDNVRVGADVVSVGAIEASVNEFGERFIRRVFSSHEIESANGSPERLAARFAAKEAAIKAFDLAEIGVDWRNIEVRSDTNGRPTLCLYGNVARRASELGTLHTAVSLSHEGNAAFALVVALVSSHLSGKDRSAHRQ